MTLGYSNSIAIPAMSMKKTDLEKFKAKKIVGACERAVTHEGGVNALVAQLLEQAPARQVDEPFPPG